MAISKIILNGVTQMDVTQDTVEAGKLLYGETATKNDGTGVTGTIASKSSSDLTASGATVTAPAGYYASAASKSVSTTAHPNPTVSVNSTTGLITASHTQTAGYVSAGTTTGTEQLSVQAGTTITPTESEQTAVAAGKYTTGAVKVGAISSTYVGSDIARCDETNLTVGDDTVYVEPGYYAEMETKSVASGMVNTPIATKGTVNNHAISVTPSVSYNSGYIRAGSTSGTAVSVSASELVSGTLSITSSGTTDVTNYASAFVAAGSAAMPATSITANPSISVSSGGLITATASAEQNVTPAVSAGYVSSGTAGTVTVSGSNTQQLSTQAAATITPSTSQQTAVAAGKYTTGAVTVAPIPSEYIIPTGTKTITENGTGIDVAQYANVDVSVSGGGGSSAERKQVNFIDYDGTILYSYTATEANALTTLPANPSHSGLVAQGWNWTLAQIKSQLTAMPDGPVWVGQMYITQSGNTEIDITLDNADFLSPYLAIAVNGTVVVDWGDGTTTDTVTGTSDTTLVYTQHVYAQTGSYTISISVSSGKFTFCGGNNYASVLRTVNAANNRARNRSYSGSITQIRIGNNAYISSSAFYNCYALTTITIPDGVTSIGSSAFYNCYALTTITIPDGVTSIGSSAFQNCYAFTTITIPDGVTSIGSYTFQNFYTLTTITIPDGVTSIGSSAFQNCYAMEEYHLLPTTPPTLASTNAFSGIMAGTIIYVPYSADHSILAAYQAGTNWSTYASYMQEEPQ